MSAIMERLSNCFYLDEQVMTKRNLVVTVVSSFLVSQPKCQKKICLASINNISSLFFQFTVAWWLVIDSSATDNRLYFSHYLCGILGTISFIMVNTVTTDMVRDLLYETLQCECLKIPLGLIYVNTISCSSTEQHTMAVAWVKTVPSYGSLLALFSDSLVSSLVCGF